MFAFIALLPLSANAADGRPNILLIVADDLGYADLGSYGSEISTPNIDSLAREGLLFTQFHTGPMCGPSRAMLLSGNNNHVAGIGRQTDGRDLIVDRYLPGYEGHLSDRVVPLPKVLRDSGYHTYTVGKWHLGADVEHAAKPPVRGRKQACGFFCHRHLPAPEWLENLCGRNSRPVISDWCA